MKRILMLLTLLAVALFAEPEWADSYTAGLQKAQKENKLVMVMLSQEGCDACWYMKNVVFDNDDVLSELEMDFVPVYIDIHDDRVPEGLRYIGTPTFHVLNGEGKRIERLDGAANVKEFTDFMRDAKKAAGR